jgi:CHAT domain-containing protein
MLFYITLALIRRADVSRQPEDVRRSITYLRYLRGQPLETFNVPPQTVSGLLVGALGIQVEMRLGDVRQDIEEMAVLCHELLKSDMPTTFVAGFFMRLVRAVIAPYGKLSQRQEPYDKVIGCLREANVRLRPMADSHGISVALALSLYNRFRIAYSNNDYEEGVTILDKVICGSGNRPTQAALILVATFARTRYNIFGKPEYLQEAINRTRTLLGEAFREDTLRPSAMYRRALLQAQEYHFDDSGVASGVQEEHLRNSGGFDSDNPSFQDLTASLTELNADNQDKHLAAIHSIDRITDGAEVEEAIKYFRRLLASSHHGSDFAHVARLALGELFRRAFSCTNEIEYLNEAISIHRDNLDTQGVFGLPVHANFHLIRELIKSLSIRFNLRHRSLRREDFDETMQLYPVAVNDEYARIPDRFLLSCDWARTARIHGHSSTSAAYECAISLMQDTLTLAPTLDIQHSLLVHVTKRDRYEDLSLDHASFYVSTGQLPRAIETLERGRALIWSEMRGLRTSIDQIRATDSHLAEEFAEVNRKLEMLTFDIPANSSDDGRDDGSVKMDPFGHLVVQQRKLVNDRSKLISQIQALLGFETFLKPSSFDKLHYAAARGPVIIINHCSWRSDILILLHNSPHPSLIPTPDDFYDRSNNLRDRLLGARKEGLDSDQYEDALTSVLKELYELVGRPVIQRLNELGVPEQSRVWWCPTSVFCSLPLHAMGPILPKTDPAQYFLDLYIPSYTTTLSTLIESNNPGSLTLDKPSILLVSQPDTLPGTRGEMRVVKATNTQVTALVSAKATPTTVLEGLRDHRFAHFVCHGTLEAGKPFGASFELYEGERLSSHDIVQSRLHEAEFAFLSACHTAELTEDSIADEALHLAAAMQYCGFRSVVGTMWAMLDEDGRELAKNFYAQVFSVEGEGVRYYERTAEALRDAVKFLRGKKGTLERWVNFVHFGA